MERTAYFIGYNSLEDFMTHADPALPVYLSLVSHEERGPHGVPIVYGEVRAFQIRDGLAHYWLFRAATMVGFTDEKKVKAAHSALDCVRSILAGRGFSVVPATVAVPRDLRLMRAGTGLMHFDEDRYEYVLTEPEAV